MFDRLRRTCSVSLIALLLGTAPLVAASVDGDAARSFLGDGFGWLLLQPQTSPTAGEGDPAALRVVAGFFQDKNPRAALGLEAYLQRFPRDPAAFDLAGVVLMQTKEYDKAAIAFRKAVQIDPKNSWSWSKLGASLLLSEDAEGARAALSEANRLDPDNPLALRFLATMAVQANNLPEAVMYSERALRGFSLPGATVNQAHFDLAELYARMGRHRDILDLLRPAVSNDALELPPEARLELYGRYMDAAMQLGDAKEARLGLDRIKPMVNLADPRIQLSEARLLRLEGDARSALAQIQMVAMANPDMVPQMRGDLAQFLEGAGQIDAALAQLKLGMSEQGAEHGTDFLREIVAVLLRSARGEEAAALVAETAAKDPTRPELQLLEAETLSQIGKLAEAKAKLDAILAADPGSLEALYMAGSLAAAQGDKPAGAAFLERSLKIDPAQPKVWLTLLGIIHGHDTYTGGDHGADGGGHQEVEDLLLRAAAANPASADLHSELGLMYLSDGRLPEAIKAFDAAVTASPGHVAGLSLGALARADLGEDLETARAMIERANAAAPDEVINQDILGWVMARQGEVEAGVALMANALAVVPADVTIQYHLGVAEMDRGNLDLARPHLLASLAGGAYSHNAADARARIQKAYPATELVFPVNRIDGAGLGAEIGTITLRQTDKGLEVVTDLQGLPPGNLAMHVHLNPTCAPADGVAGAMAQGHYGAHAEEGSAHHHAGGTETAEAGHAGTHSAEHAGAKDAAHHHSGTTEATAAEGSGAHAAEHVHAKPAAVPRGDLPLLTVADDGSNREVLTHPELTLNEIRARSVMIHADASSPQKIACGVIP